MKKRIFAISLSLAMILGLSTMRELGIAPTEEEILAMADGCTRASGGKKGSAKVLYPEDMAAIYRMAL